MCFTSKKKVHEINDFKDSSEDESDEFFVYTVEDPKADKADEWFTHLKTNGTEIQYKLDTGSQVNIITEQLLNKLRKKTPKSTNQNQTYILQWELHTHQRNMCVDSEQKTTSLQAALRSGIRITHSNHRSQCLQQIRTGQESVYG